MAVGKPPFRAQNHVELLRKIEKGEDRIRFPDEKVSPDSARQSRSAQSDALPVPDDLKAIIRSLLKRNPIERCAFTDFFEAAEKAAVAGPAAVLLNRTPNMPALGATHSRRPSTDATPRAPNAALPAPEPMEEETGAFVKSAPRLTPAVPLQQQASAPSPVKRAPSFAPKYVVGSTNAHVEGSRPVTPLREAPVLQKLAAAGPMPVDIIASPAANKATLAGNGQPKEQPARLNSGTPDLVTGSRCVHTSSLVLTAKTTHSAEDDPPRRPLTPRSSSGLHPAPIEVADDDSVLGREYVVVEKRTVEINALADGVSNSALRLQNLT